MNSENLVRTACDSSRLWLKTPYESRDVCCLRSQEKRKGFCPLCEFDSCYMYRRQVFVSQLENTVQLLNVQLVINKLTRFHDFYPFSSLGGHFALFGVYVHKLCVQTVCVCVCAFTYFSLAGSSALCPPSPLCVSCLTSLFLLRLETLGFDTFESNGQTRLVFLYCTLHHVLVHSQSSSSPLNHLLVNLSA